MAKFEEKVPLAKFSNYKIGGPAEFFFEAKNVREVEWAAKEAKNRGLEIFVLGGGTNLLIGDEGIKGLVLKPNLNFTEANRETLSAGAGILMSELLDFAAEKGLSGLEWAGGLPGTLGGAIRGNAGAFGGEIKDNIAEVESFDAESGERRKRTKKECEFGYRDSVFKKLGGREIVLSAVFKMKNGDSGKIKKDTEEKIEYRRSRHPLEYPNIGSIFKNVAVESLPKEILVRCADVIKKDPFPVVPTARLIKLAGLKGKTSGGAMISPKHGNFIVNTGGARASDVKYLIDLIKREIKNKFGIVLEEEVQMV